MGKIWKPYRAGPTELNQQRNWQSRDLFEHDCEWKPVLKGCRHCIQEFGWRRAQRGNLTLAVLSLLAAWRRQISRCGQPVITGHGSLCLYAVCLLQGWNQKIVVK